MARAKTQDEASGGDATTRSEKRPFETVRALVIAVVVALGIRSFVVEPFKIPSGSMIPTLLIGDYILVNKSAYGVRNPLTGGLFIPTGEPQRGDVVVFRYPDDPRIDYIKRIVGMPGDLVEMRDGRLWVNGQIVDRVAKGEFTVEDPRFRRPEQKRLYKEVAPEGREYNVIRDLAPMPNPRSPTWAGSWHVPEGAYFMMGDNRDGSKDSRLWKNTFVRPEQIKGKAFMIHWSWVLGGESSAQRGFIEDFLNTIFRVITFQVETIRWDRIGSDVDGLAVDSEGSAE